MHDYRRKAGVEHAEIVLPKTAGAWAQNRAELWNRAEEAEGRKNSVVAREIKLALPAELDAEQRRELALDFAGELADRATILRSMLRSTRRTREAPKRTITPTCS